MLDNFYPTSLYIKNKESYIKLSETKNEDIIKFWNENKDECYFKTKFNT